MRWGVRGAHPTPRTSHPSPGSGRSHRLGNPAADDRIFDITGNLREIVRDGAVFRVVGGAFNTQAESGAHCDFDIYSVAQTFRFYDTGFRCCFTSDPRL